MNWNEWEAVWRRQAPPVGASADIADLRQSFEPKRRKLACALVARDLSEAAAGVLCSAVFAYTWWKLGREAWPLGLAIALILGVSAFFCSERVRAHRNRVGPDAPMMEKLEAEISELRHQGRLLSNISTWYLAPIFASWAIAVLTLMRHAARHSPPGMLMELMRNPVTAAYIVGYFAVFVPLTFWGVWWLNRRAVSRRIGPRIEELEKLRRGLAPP